MSIELSRKFLVEIYRSENLLKEIKNIYVSRQKIKSINLNAFYELVNLEMLSLTENGLEDINERLFESLSSLKILYLNGNKLKRIKPKAFYGLYKLEVLWLKENEIEEIEENAFKSTSKLEVLWLNKNRLKRIDSNTFKGLLNLQRLSLSSNEIESIELENLPRLKYLDLSFNMLKKIDSNSFKRLKYLECLELNYNLITEINENGFEEIPKLKLLKLNNNKLNNINRKCFETLKSIKVIQLFDNDNYVFSFFDLKIDLDSSLYDMDKLSENDYFSDWNEFIDHIYQISYTFHSAKLLIVDYYDSLISDIDIYTEEILEKYTENDVIPNEEQNYILNNEKNLEEVENHKFFEIESIIDPYKEEYKFDEEQTNFKPGSIKLHDYVNQIRSKSIEEINKVKEENLQQYEINRDKYKYDRNDLSPAKVEEIRRELFKEKFCFLLRIDNVFDVIIPIKYITIITDFYLDYLDLYKLTNNKPNIKRTLKNSFPYNFKLTQNAFLVYLLAKYVINRLYYEIYGNEVIFITRDDLFKIERINGVETNLFFVENNKRGDFELNTSNDYSNIKSLGITKGNYSKLEDLGNSMTKIEYLYISNMSIDSDVTFNIFNKLIKLSLEDCPMNNDLKWSLKNLQILEIREFLIGDYSIDLESLENLKILILQSVESFDCLKNLGRKFTGLSISSSVIFEDKKPISSFLRRHDFSNVTNLRLHLSPKSVNLSIWFKSFKSLKKLSLIGSCRNCLNLEFLQTESLNQLEYLNLSDNSILTIRKEDFSQLKSLKHLDISKNRISHIDPEVFAQTAPLLAHLNIRGNKCKIEEKTFYSLFKNLKTIEFD